MYNKFCNNISFGCVWVVILKSSFASIMCPYARRRSPSRLVSLDRFAHVLPTRDRDATFEFIEFIEHSRNSVKVLVYNRVRASPEKRAHTRLHRHSVDFAPILQLTFSPIKVVTRAWAGIFVLSMQASIVETTPQSSKVL